MIGYIRIVSDSFAVWLNLTSFTGCRCNSTRKCLQEDITLWNTFEPHNQSSWLVVQTVPCSPSDDLFKSEDGERSDVKNEEDEKF